MITGAAGLVGTALTRAFGPEAFPLTHRELDIGDAAAVRARIAALHPAVVLNCAVLGVDECEEDPKRASRINVDGPRFLAEACQLAGAAIVHFSTNYVFDGDRAPHRPYGTEDEARPVNVYGATKLEGERAVADACARAIIVRTSWVYGPGKESFLSTAAAKLGKGQRVRAITDTWASTTWVEDLVVRVRDLVEGGRYGTHHAVNDGACSYETFALECARITGADPALIDRTTEAAMKRRARRPRSTPMTAVPPMRHWREALAASLNLH
ncbi:MAG TPA: SDR family oxidoreductase [Thermoanaerobaculia bacterium]|nr:SDR family oxidoreductase [Thermoanaerobaculia bacterium]